ncbi:hypothetical protein ACH489_01400 [Streptomyces rubiginosohelvolus]|uniref:hypothetical protein n=1 Tax=Streptomyces rubiginosohelvolus TaxID=67362 RepID=UPI0037B3B8AD
MANALPTDAYRCGQLYAVITALEKLASPNGRSALDLPGARAKAAKRPYDHLHKPLNRAVEFLMAARARRKGTEAEALFLAIPALLPQTLNLPRSFGDTQQEQFGDGFHAWSATAAGKA